MLRLCMSNLLRKSSSSYTTCSMPPVRHVHKAGRKETKSSRREKMELASSTAKSTTVQKPLDPDEPPVLRVVSPWRIGAHVSAAGGVENAVVNAAKIGANAFALFVKSQRKWSSPPLKEESIQSFRTHISRFGYSPAHILPHGSYLINLGNPDKEKRQKSFDCFLDDLRRCETLGLQLYNFHPGSTVGATTPDVALSLIAESINKAHKATQFITTVIENMAGSGNTLGATFSDLAEIIRKVEDKKRIGVCLDTCHLFAAGFDITTPEGWQSVVSEFDRYIGLSYLRAMHLNDSKAALGTKKDRHENIGMGYLGLSTFRHIVSDSRLQEIPLILETPDYGCPDVWKKELEVLNKLTEEGTPSMESLADEITNLIKHIRGVKGCAAQ